MKGLVFKDLLLMKKMNKKVIFVMYFFVIAISFFGENEVYSIMSSAFFSLFIGMHLMMTMTYDGLTSWKQYELTLPLSKYQIIFSKYLTSLLLVPISIMGTVIIYIIRYVVYHNFTLSQFGFSIAIAIALPVLWCSICLAIAQWFGYMSVQYVRMICTLLVIFFVSKISKDMKYVTQNLVKNPMLIAIFALVAVPFLVKQSLGTSRPLVVIPGTFLGGAVFCMMCDLIARMAFAPLELSISTVTSIFGAPVVIFMMLRRKRG